MSAATDLINTIITNAIATAGSKQSAADSYAEAAMTAAASTASTNPPSISFTPNTPGFNPEIPAHAAGNSNPLFQSTYHQIKADLETAFTTFFATYFPSECNFIADAQQWICDTLENGGTGMNANVEDQIWQRDRARVLADANRIEEETLVTWAGKGYALPPGAATYAVLRARQAAQDKIAQASRDVAVKQAEIEIENVRLAIKMALEYRIGAVNAAAEYIKALALGPEIAAKMATSAANAQAELISAASSYFRAQVELEGLRLDALKTSGQLRLGGQIADVQAFTARSSNMTQAATAAATSAGHQAAAALNSLHSQSTISAIENS